MSTPKREAPPALYYRSPDCSICGEEVSHDGDSFYCEHCDAYWPDDHGEGEWYHDDAEQCGSTHQPMAKNRFAEGESFRFKVVRCLLDSGHQPPHRDDSVTTWTDETAVNGMGGAS